MQGRRCNIVFRSIEGTAHGFFSLLPHQYVLCVGVGLLLAITLHPLLGAVALVGSAIAIVQGRRAANDRRDYLELWTRRSETTRHYRILDPDDEYEPWGFEADR